MKINIDDVKSIKRKEHNLFNWSQEWYIDVALHIVIYDIDKMSLRYYKRKGIVDHTSLFLCLSYS